MIAKPLGKGSYETRISAIRVDGVIAEAMYRQRDRADEPLISTDPGCTLTLGVVAMKPHKAHWVRLWYKAAEPTLDPTRPG